MRLELGAGARPTRGYTHHDAFPFPHIEHVGDPWMLELPTDSLDEVLAVAFIEHLTYDQARDTFRNVHRMLRPGGRFLFDVPDYPTWARYYLDLINGDPAPVTLEHARKTLFGWQRWPGDEHLYGWDLPLLRDVLHDTGYREVLFGVGPFIARCYRQRFHRPLDAHLYVTAIK